MFAMWIGCPIPSRWLDASFSTFLLPASSFLTRSVSVTDGAMAFTRIFHGAYSTAMDRVIDAMGGALKDDCCVLVVHRNNGANPTEGIGPRVGTGKPL